MSSRNLAIIAVVVLIIIGIGWVVVGPKQQPPPTPTISTPAPLETSTPATEGGMVKEQNLVTVTGDGFSPKDITIKVGESVTWLNKDTTNHTVNSALHPTHLVYPPLNLGTIEPGDSKSLTFPEAGTYKYHDHLNPSLFGSVTVQ